MTEEQYLVERAICDKAHAYWEAHASYSKNGWSSMGPELRAHPDYAACSNDTRGRVESYEILRDLPDSFTAYLTRTDGRLVLSVWTGIPLGAAVINSSRATPLSYDSNRYYYGTATIGGVAYYWRGAGEGMCCRVRKSKRRARIAAKQGELA